MSRQSGVLVLLGVLLCFSLGCGLSGLPQIGGSGETSEASPEVALATVESEESEESVDGADVAQATPESDAEAEEELDLSSVTSGLESLSSYTASFVMSFSDQDQSTTSTYGMEIETIREPLAQRVVIEGDVAEGTIEMVRIGERQYITVGGGQCVQTSLGEGDDLVGAIVTPDDVMGGASGLKRVLPDQTVNGVLCKHYVFDEEASLSGSYTEVQGEVWIAVDGGYVVKYSMEAEGQSPLSNESGHVTMDYEVRSVNQTSAIEPPVGCADIESSYPMLPDASEVSAFGESLMYQTSSAIADVIAFYQDEMSAIGWTESSDSFVSDDSAMLQFTQGSQSVTVSVSLNEDGSVAVVVMAQ
ncbi:MAG: hypothetical protein GX620_14040 [Chloroflexi bacterium]|nr:hypothetical protein [Chloroflexota bacterium]